MLYSMLWSQVTGGQQPEGANDVVWVKDSCAAYILWVAASREIRRRPSMAQLSTPAAPSGSAESGAGSPSHFAGSMKVCCPQCVGGAAGPVLSTTGSLAGRPGLPLNCTSNQQVSELSRAQPEPRLMSPWPGPPNPNSWPGTLPSWLMTSSWKSQSNASSSVADTELQSMSLTSAAIPRRSPRRMAVHREEARGLPNPPAMPSKVPVAPPLSACAIAASRSWSSPSSSSSNSSNSQSNSEPSGSPSRPPPRMSSMAACRW
mmetsp:Transcript_8828/g.25438  ORF Transcript_8828/g.25438 Transcript_8828/m.25438 type:complete len:260 (-) Transcript_8828:428-1207(-)